MFSRLLTALFFCIVANEREVRDIRSFRRSFQAGRSAIPKRPATLRQRTRRYVVQAGRRVVLPGLVMMPACGGEYLYP